MKFIIDTHIFLWYINGDIKLSKKYIETIENESNTIYLSYVSLWEITIKLGLGKLHLELSIDEIYRIIETLKIKLLIPTKFDLEILLNLENIHKDPFDRMLISQAKASNMSIITDDNLIKNYNIGTVV